VVYLGKEEKRGAAMKKKILFAGESWFSHTIHTKGFDSFTTSTYEEGAGYLMEALKSGGYDITYIPNHKVQELFPSSLKHSSASMDVGVPPSLEQIPTELALGSCLATAPSDVGVPPFHNDYDCVILSDIGANTLQLSDRVFMQGEREPDKCEMIRDFVLEGGSFLMIGGYMSFSGINAVSRYHDTAIADILPVSILKTDDRVEIPKGILPTVKQPEHPIFEGIPQDEPWPYFLGYNRTIFSGDGNSQLLAEIGGDPFIAVTEPGDCGGRSAIFSSDCAPHWGSPAFLAWEHYTRLWVQILDWLTGSS
jgi:uncharacterized membrane protein